MIARILRLLVVLGVILGVVLPKASAALAGLGLSNARSVLICTGHGMQRVDLKPGHGPHHAPAPSHDEPLCLLVHALDGALAPPSPHWLALAHAAFMPSDIAMAHVETPSRTRFARAPPRA
ncbi:DUF2946 family protein [Paracoccus salsus]|uniref:DUF2946 family protein n=1 Tax=Paracoccus salsus TaxID=2911061 RepID=UPI001F1CDC0A|nr:DUF2946 family protein [Paracoccus salsus]MCF3972731.1 hypothetical protein [Paracoccus salsus]